MLRERRKYLAYNSEAADRVCELLIEGLSLRKICEMEGMPSRRAIFYWLEKNEEFRQRYELARGLQAEAMSHELLEIADDSSKDFIITEDGREVVNHEAINRSRLRVDTRKFLMSKLLPRKYGDKIQVDGGVDIEADALSAEEFAERMRQEIRESFREWKPSEDKESSMWPLLDEPVSEKRSALAQDADHGEPSPEANHSASSPPREYSREGPLEAEPSVARLPTRYRPPRSAGRWSN
jgi:hypothetical protein